MTTLTELKALMAKATPRPWEFVPWHIAEGPSEIRAPEGWLICTTSNDANASMISGAINALPALIAAVEALKQIDDTLSGSLPITQQCKAIARAALDKLGE